ncbi:RluA family pseudouridine synthase [Microlunatus speluncae]|uniref:RluA family pseudouridine synthase n=1 Tax=Microlunatus speluncae TaxID=2594267 RepID=UPI001C2CE344|nr:RNA pseudouridine synthase [Microlunatus speluncae]
MNSGHDWATLRAACCYEDAAVLALNKPAGISVMGERHETDLVRIAAEAGETLYPVHRIDKVTSGLILFAKDLELHGGLTRQFARRTAAKRYLAVVRPGGLPPEGTIDLPLSTGRKGRIRIAADRSAIAAAGDPPTWSVPDSAVNDRVRSYPSTTLFRRLAAEPGQDLLSVAPVSGRRHQIRVHLAWIGHAIAGDPLFRAGDDPAPRTGLHSWRLAIDAEWAQGRRIRIEAAPGADFWDLCHTDTPEAALSAAWD